MSIPGLNLTLTAIEGVGLGALSSSSSSANRGLTWTNATTTQGQTAQTTTLSPDVTIEEIHDDELVITDHPVESGAAITDHIYKRPAMLTIRAAWSNTPSGTNGGTFGFIGSTLSGLAATTNTFSTGSVVKGIYEKLIALQSSGDLINVVTGKRSYVNMLIQSIRANTDEKSENALFVSITLRQVIIVETKVTTLAPASQQSMAKITQSPIPTGLNTLISSGYNPSGFVQ